MRTLIITNGDIAAEKMREAKIHGEILPWRDVLHEGPVPHRASLEELSAVRADYLAFRGWGDVGAIGQVFAARDAVMRALSQFSDVTLWFEHDLYDQLQLLQVLDVVAREAGPTRRCHLIQAGSFVGGGDAHRLRMHLKLKQPVSEAQLDLAQAAWGAFCAPSPERWAALLRYDTAPLPFLRSAILRQLDEFPGRGGLSRTEAFILSAVRDGITDPSVLFAAYQDAEEARFMGDWSFFAILDALSGGAAPFLTGLKGGPHSPWFEDWQREIYFGSRLRLTGLGMTTIAGKKDAIAFRRLDRWMGGVHLSNGHCWRWDGERRRLVAPNGRNFAAKRPTPINSHS